MPHQPPERSDERVRTSRQGLGPCRGIATPAQGTRVLPSIYRGCPGEPSAEGDHQDQRALLDPSLLEGLVEGDRDRRRTHIPVPLDIDIYLIHRDTRVTCGRLDDTDIGLMWDDQVDLAGGDSSALERLIGCLCHRPDR